MIKEAINRIISKYQNKKIISLRKQNKYLTDQIITLALFIKDRKLMDERNFDRANEIKSVCEVQLKTPSKTYNQAIGICGELKSSIVASDQLLNQIDKSIFYNSNIDINEIQQGCGNYGNI